jgi:hypothetical protein
MCKWWWWWWFPGLHKKWKVKKRRASALVFIEAERARVQQMADRPRDKDSDPIDRDLLNSIMERLSSIEDRARTASAFDYLSELMDIAEVVIGVLSYGLNHRAEDVRVDFLPVKIADVQ